MTARETPAAVPGWPLRLFGKSVLKQRKLREVTSLLGPVEGLDCLDLGGDNGVISYLLRRGGGRWTSADLDEDAVRAIGQLVGPGVHRVGDGPMPFDDDRFDRVAVVDFLEHIEDDRAFIDELFRIVRPGGAVVCNVPHVKHSLLRRFRLAIGQTDEKHGHVRPGYTIDALVRLLGDRFTVESSRTYSRFFSEAIDTWLVFCVSWLKGESGSSSRKGLLVTGQDLGANRSMFRAYSLIYPVVWCVSQLDRLLFFTSGYMLIVRARTNKPPRSS